MIGAPGFQISKCLKSKISKRNLKMFEMFEIENLKMFEMFEIAAFKEMACDSRP
jgi:hypothetical protein